MTSDRGFERGLLEGTLEIGNLGKRLITENIGKAIAILTAILAVLATFLDVALPELSLRSITTEVILLLIAAYVIYFSLYESGESEGRGSEAYKAARVSYEDIRRKIDGRAVEELREFCLEYAKEELIYRRRQVLVSEAVSEEEYEAYKKGGVCEKTNIRLFRRIDRMKAHAINPRDLVECEVGASSATIRNPKRGKPLAIFIKLIPITLSMLFTVSMIITAKDGLDLAGVMSGIIKLGCLPIVALRGYVGGYAYSAETLVGWYNARRDLLATFLDRREKRQEAKVKS